VLVQNVQYIQKPAHARPDDADLDIIAKLLRETIAADRLALSPRQQRAEDEGLGGQQLRRAKR